ncbi:MAG TPA: circularly permuted type 2 ATP-grasp protein [Pseudomonadales bacterium]|nr:circularly permuted type 2 ATP-grasp protein [Pseudomonadales bacterium]
MSEQPVTPAQMLVPPAYLEKAVGHDELFGRSEAGSRTVRRHWQSLFGAFQQLGGRDLEARRLEARRLFRENGVSYSAASEGAAQVRPWELDPIPFLIPAEDWTAIETGLNQRARLLDAILKDLYGPRHLIRNGMVPPELIFRHTGFLLPSDGSLDTDSVALTMYAADVVRGGDGAFRVLSDRTQTPSGAGLALETRIASSRILPNLIRSSHVHRLARFFRLLRGHLAERAPHQKLDPRIVVLSQGPADPNYFDHAYLASYLGYPLVEGADLTVRDSHLWLRTIEGLKLVDIVFRRVPDHLCDPLELVPDSRVGIPGLLEVARRGNVGIVNPLGSGVLENPGLIPYLPRIARQFLGEDLRMESVDTWWCGDEKGLSHVLANLQSLVIKPVNRARGAVWGGSLSAAELEHWRDRLRHDPALYVGQAAGGGSTTPALVDGSLQPRGAVTRCFVTAADDSFSVMPGGFTRVAAPGEMLTGMSAGLQGTCKDTWVLASESERHLILWPTSLSQTFEVAWESLPSRAAESLYWVGRYAERGEFLTRLARISLRKYNESRDYGDPADSGSLTILLRALRALSTGNGETTPGVLSGTEFIENTLLETVKDATLTGSLAATFKALESSAVSVRDRWSTDTWRVIDDISECMEEQRRYANSGLPALEDTLDRLVSALVGFTGLTVESTTHEHGWHFLIIGRRVERALNLIQLLRATILQEAGEGIEHQLLESLLIANESVMTHRRRYRSALDATTAVQVLVLDQTNPRSLAYQVLELQAHLQALPRAGDQRRLSDDQRALLEATTMVRLGDADELTELHPDRPHRRAHLETFLDALETQIGDAVRALNQAFFTHVQPAQQLVAVSLDAGIDDESAQGLD